MMMHRWTLIAVIALSFLAASVIADARSSFEQGSYVTNADLWPSIYPTCGGFFQSPVNVRLPGDPAGEDLAANATVPLNTTAPEIPLQNVREVIAGDDWVKSGSHKFTAIKNGTVVELFKPASPGTLLPGDTKSLCSLVNIHIHTPSEHYLLGRRYPLEMHFVHACDSEVDNVSSGDVVSNIFNGKTNDNNNNNNVPNGHNAVLSVLFDALPAGVDLENSASADFLRQFAQAGDAAVASASSTALVDIKLHEFGELLTGLTWSSYIGSLTTPPCTEGVEWIVSTTTVAAPQSSIVDLHGDVGFDNARPIQPLNGRIFRSATVKMGTTLISSNNDDDDDGIDESDLETVLQGIPPRYAVCFVILFVVVLALALARWHRKRRVAVLLQHVQLV